jgi:hypothetical protein
MPTTNINLNIDAITGVGSVDRLTKIVTLVGADGTAIVTIGNSSVVESGTTRTMSNSLGNVVFDYENSLLRSKAGGLSINCDSRYLIDTVDDIQLNWEDKWLFKNGATGSGFFTSAGIKHNNSNSLLLDIVSTKIMDSSAVDSILFESRELSNSSNTPTVNWEQKNLIGNFGTRFNWGNGVLTDDSALEVSVNELTILGAAQQGTSGQVLTTDGAGVLSWTTVSGGGGGTTTNPLTIGTGLLGTSFDGSAAVTIEIDSTVVTLTGVQALTDKTINGLTIATSTGVLSITNGKTLSISNTITLAGTDSTVITLPTATSTVLANNLGISGGITLIGGTAATDKVLFKATSGNKVTAETNTFRFTSGNNGAQELLRVGDGPTGNTGELGMHAAGQSSTTNYFLRAGTNFTYFNAGTDLRLNIAGTSLMNVSSTTITMIQGITISDAKNIVLNTTTGTKIGTATGQKLAFWNKTPIIQPTTGITAATFVANTSLIANDTATYGGYTMGQIAAALINTGILQ